jgi:asparagine synthase (glutamine-hydrolysing)
MRTEGLCTLGVASPEGVEDTSIAAQNGLTVAVCGTIDNLDDLAARWGVQGQSRTSAAGVVLAGFLRFGDGAANALRGIFSGLVADGSSIRAFRDHVGFGVLYYRAQGLDFYVATEAKQVLVGSGLAREPETNFFEGLLYDHYEDETLCALRGVRRLPQGSILSAGPNGVHWSRFWHPEDLLETARLSSKEVKELFDVLMTQAAARVLTGKDIVALSGGIDSTAVAAYASPEHRRLSGDPLAALSASYPELPRVDERPLVELVARELGLELHLFTPEARPLDGLREWVSRCDGPAPSSFAQPREMYLLARSLGFRTILSGNYAEFAIDAGQQHLVRHLVRAGRFGALRGLLRNESARGVSLGIIARQLARVFVPSAFLDIYDRRRHLDTFGPDWLDRTRIAHRVPRQVPLQGPWRQAQIASFYVPRLALEADEIEQASVGVQVRWPWADVDLWEFFLRLPAETKYPAVRPRKLLVRRLLRGKVPDAILDRQEKIGFDNAAMAWIDYGFLRRLLVQPEAQIVGVDYARLAQHLQQEDLQARDFKYIRNLAAIHVFLEEWPGRG